MAFAPDKPYNHLPLLPPTADLETRPVLKAAVSATRALAELKGAGELIPNQSVLINTIPLLEARVSSEIEQIVTTTDNLFQLASKEHAEGDPATKEALRYRTALLQGFNAILERPISTRTAVDICRTIRGLKIDIRKVPGTKIGNPATGEIVYTPPEGEDLIRNKLANLEEFIHADDDLDPLVRMAVMHYQFEAIHPFTDGNGRTGRILNILFLVQQGLLEIPVLYLSRYILQNKSRYYDLMLQVTDKQHWQEWNLFMLSAVEETARWTSQKIHAIRDLLFHTSEFVRARLPKIYTRELVELIFTQPYCRIANMVDAGIAKRQTASVYLKEMVNIGVLREQTKGRDKLFLHPKFLKLLAEDDNSYTSY